MAVTTPDGIVHVFFTELGPSASNPDGTEAHVAVIRSTDKGASWSVPTRIAELLPVGTTVPGQAQVSVRAGEILGTFAADPSDGTLYAAWQDSRFTGGAFDAIALAWSTDGGLTWSTPIRVNADPSVPAFTPTLTVLPSGWIGLTYYDFRQAGTATYRPTDVWLTVSSNGTTWRETRLAGNFDLLDAPNANGLFVGDYQGLSGDGTTFVTLYSRTNNADVSNRTDVFADRVNADSLVTFAPTPADASRKSGAQEWSTVAQDRVARHLSAAREARRVQWRAWREAATQPTPD
jgi:Neuraminidase (sialidase)